MAQIHTTSLNGMLLQLWSTLIIYRILQDLRLEVAAAQGWEDDDVSWVMLLRHIAIYREKNRGTQSLTDYLNRPRKRASLKKAGVRVRRLTELPGELIKEIRQARPPDPQPVTSRKPRRRKWPKKSAGLEFTVPLG